MNEKITIENIQKEKSDYNYESQAIDQRKGLDLFSSDVFSEYIRFLFELIQNADDANASEININVFDSFLVVSHNGDAFEEADVRGICSVGSGTKKSQANMTGYKGIGFKSVFGQSTYVAIFSNGFQFRFDETYRHPKFKIMPWQIIPQWTEKDELPKEVRNFDTNSWTVSTIIQIDITEELLNDLNELLKSSQVLLFLRNLKCITSKGKIETTIQKFELTEGIIELIKNQSEKSTWLVQKFNGKLDPEIQKKLRDNKNLENRNIPDKIRFQENYEISFAAKLEKNKLVSLSDKETLIFTYLPTKVKNCGFPFLVNSNFLADTSREHLHEDNAWNQWLMEIAGKKIIDWLAELSKSEFALQILHLLPEQSKSTTNKLTKSFFESFHGYSKVKPFILNKDGVLKTPIDIVIDTTGLSNETDFVDSKVLIEFINMQNPNDLFKTDSFAHPELELANEKLPKIGSFRFDLTKLEDFFIDDLFKNNHQPTENFALIKYFYNKANSDTKINWNEKLQFIPFIKAKGNATLRSPKFICLPSKGDLSELEKNIKIIHPTVYKDLEKNQDILEWLINLGVTEVSEIKWLENEIFPSILNLNYASDYIDITKSIFHLHKQKSLKQLHYSQLSEFKLLCKNDRFIEANNCYLSDFYLPELPLEKVYNNCNYISESYCINTDINKTDFKSFLISINVSENISLKKHSSDLYWGSAGDHRYRDFIDRTYNDGSSNWSYHSGGFSESHAFRNFIEFTMMHYTKTSYQFSKLFWNSLLSNYSTNTNIFDDITLLHGWSRNYHTRVKNYIKWFIEENECIPTTQESVLNSKHVFINHEEIRFICSHYLPAFDYDKPISPLWLEVFQFKKELKLHDYLSILNKIAEEYQEDDELKKLNKERIVLIYEKIANQLKNLSNEEIAEIKNWSANNKLLSNKGSYQHPSELFWIKGKTNTLSKNELDTIYLPNKIELENEFENLLSVFGVTIISDFKIIPNGNVTNNSLKNDLLAISPYLAAVIEKKKGVDFEVVLTKMKTSIEKLKVINAEKLELAYIYNDKLFVISKPDSYYDEIVNTLYFIGEWESPKTMYSLIEYISRALNIFKYQEELRLFLLLNTSDISAWLKDKLDIDTNYFEEKPIVKETLSHITKTDVCFKSDLQNQIELYKNKIEQLEEELQQYRLQTGDNQLPIKPDITPKGTTGVPIEDQILANIEARRATKTYLLTKTSEGYDVSEWEPDNGFSAVKGKIKKNGEYIDIVVKSAKWGDIFLAANEFELLCQDSRNQLFVYNGLDVKPVTLKTIFTANSLIQLQIDTNHINVKFLGMLAKAFQYVTNTKFVVEDPNYSAHNLLNSLGMEILNEGFISAASKDEW